MGAALYPYAPPSVTRLVIAWLQPLDGPGSAGARRPADGPLPFRMVTPIAGKETVNRARQQARVSVHTFAADYNAAESAAQITHQRMLLLGPPFTAQQTVTITNGDGTAQDVTPDYVTTDQIPIWMEYQDDLIFRFVARYEIGLRFVPS